MDDKITKPTEGAQAQPAPPANLNTPTTAPTNPVTAETPITSSPASFNSKTSGGKKLFGKISVIPAIIIGIALLGSSTVAAYYGILVPNKPENVFKTAITNTLEQKKSKFEGKFSYESTEAEAAVKVVNVTFNGQSDSEKNASQASFEITASGVKLPFEVRSLEKSIYFKVGDLSSVKSLAELAAPGYGDIIDAVNDKLANQWIEIDETLLKQAKLDCALNISMSPTKADIELIQKRYSEAPFSVIRSSSKDTVAGRSTLKIEMEIDDNKATEFAKGLQELSFVKKFKECQPDSAPVDTNEMADNEITPVTVWVDRKTKTISKIALQSTKKSEEKIKAKGSFEVTFSYGEANISKPDGAKPAIQIMNDLQSLIYGQAGALGTESQDLDSFSFD